MRIESDIEAALGSEDSEPSQASELEVMRPHLVDSLEGHEAPAPVASNGTSWVIVVAALGLVASLLAAAALLFGGVLLSALAWLTSQT